MAKNKFDKTPEDLLIRIPMDIFLENNTYQCPSTVTIGMTHELRTPRRSVGNFNAKARPTNATDVTSRTCRSLDAHATCTAGDGTGSGIYDLNLATNALSWSATRKAASVIHRRGATMEQGESPREGLSPATFLDVIDMVAKANEQQSDSSGQSTLPEIRSNPCPMHQRQQHTKRLLYATNFHAGHVPDAPPSFRSGSSGRDGALESQIQLERTKTFQQDILAGRRQCYTKPVLPEEMTSRDFVTSWLTHGSQPQGKNHFPGVVKRQPGRRVTGLEPKTQNCGKKQTLAPLETNFPLQTKPNR